jgi:spore coat protein A
MRPFRQRLQSLLAPTTVWGYGSPRVNSAPFHSPGFTFEARRGRPVIVKWINHLPTNGHLFPIDFSLHWANPTSLPSNSPPNTPFPIPTVTHLHGGFSLPQFDGHPEAWFTPHGSPGQPTGTHYVSDLYTYGNDQRAATLWYHDHTEGLTRVNLYAGLAGFYLLRDEYDTGHPGHGLNLPTGPYEIPLMIQDRSINPADGSLLYPGDGQGAPPPVPPVWVPEFFGDVAVVNGRIWPFAEVEPRKYRFRIVNACNARVLRLFFNRDLPFHQIGNDGGLLPAPVTIDKLVLAPAERADVIVDFASLRGRVIELVNDAPNPFPEGEEGVDPLAQIMQFRVTRMLRGRDTCDIPTAHDLAAAAPAPLGEETLVRDIALDEQADPSDSPIILTLEGKTWDEPVVTKPKQGATEIWRLINPTGDTHPIHLHLVQFEVLDRQPFDMEAYLRGEGLHFTGPPVPREENEAGRKDTVRANPGEVTRIKAKFDLPTYGQIVLPPRVTAPQYVMHCHILEHEDNQMMRPYEVVE